LQLAPHQLIFSHLIGRSVPLLNWLSSQEGYRSISVLFSGFEDFGSSFEVYQWAQQNFGKEVEAPSALNGAIKRGNLEMVKKIWDLPEFKMCFPLSLANAHWTSSLTLEILIFLTDRGVQIHRSPWQLCGVGRCSLTIVKWVIEGMNIRNFDELIFQCIVESSPQPLDVIEYFLQTFPDIPTTALIESALELNRVDVLRHLAAKGFRITDKNSRKYRKLKMETLQFLSTFFERDQFVTLLASLPPVAGNLVDLSVDVWRYLVSYGVKPTEKDLSHALWSNSSLALDTVRYLVEEMRLPLSPPRCWEARYLRKDIVRYLQEKGIVVDDSPIRSFKLGSGLV
jgi:hypothetical protein